jgi:hypothetical protein
MSFIFFFYKIGEQEVLCVRREGGWYQWEWEGEDVEKVCRRVNIVQIPCTHVCKWKNETC